MLLETSASAREIAELVGIENYTYFTKLFKKKTGMSPSVYRRLFAKDNGNDTKSP